jgi:uncharacterized protein (TIGR02453 family)
MLDCGRIRPGEESLPVHRRRSPRAVTPPEPFRGFDRALFRFLRALRRNNRRPWFEAHRDEYEQLARRPMRAFVEECDTRLALIAPELVGDPRRSMFRIHRDIRFSRDKSPYKTHIACWFYHADAGRGVGRDAHGGAGFYVHIEPRRSMIGGGIWMPPRAELAAIRTALAERHGAFRRIVHAPAFRRRFGSLDDEAMLRRVPRGFAADHPAGEWLRYQSFTAGRMLSDREVLDPALAARLERDLVVLRPLVRWLNTAIGYHPRERRL